MVRSQYGHDLMLLINNKWELATSDMVNPLNICGPVLYDYILTDKLPNTPYYWVMDTDKFDIYDLLTEESRYYYDIFTMQYDTNLDYIKYVNSLIRNIIFMGRYNSEAICNLLVYYIMKVGHTNITINNFMSQKYMMGYEQMDKCLNGIIQNTHKHIYTTIALSRAIYVYEITADSDDPGTITHFYNAFKNAVSKLIRNQPT